MDITKKAEAKVLALKNRVEEIAFASIRKNKKFIIEQLLQGSQLSKGFASDGERLSFESTNGPTSGFYTMETQKKSTGAKKSKTQGNPYNFEWTGDTFAGMELVKAKLGYQIITKDGKDLEKYYGNIYDLNPENEILVEEAIVETEFEKEFRKLFDSLL